jgi:hypothetical protein
MARAQRRVGLLDGVRVVSGYAAGRAGYWCLRFFVAPGRENLVVDSARRDGRRCDLSPTGCTVDLETSQASADRRRCRRHGETVVQGTNPPCPMQPPAPLARGGPREIWIDECQINQGAEQPGLGKGDHIEGR